MMHVTFEPTADDFIAGSLSFPPPSGWVQYRVSAAWFALAMGLAVVMLVGGRFAVEVAAVVFVLVVIAFGVVSWPSPRRTRRIICSAVRTYLASRDGQKLLAERTYTITAEGVLVESGYASQLLRWPLFTACGRNDDFLFLYVPGPMVHVLPRVAFETDRRFDEFADAAERYIVESGKP